jgi:uncharacterized protein
MSFAEILTLTAAGALAGTVNAVAGGGTLITFPALLLCNTPAIVANATNTLALVLGMAGSMYGYRRQFGVVKPWLKRFAGVSILGGLLGGILLTLTEEKLFSRLVPFLLLFATVIFMAQEALRRFALPGGQPAGIHRHAVGAAIAFQFLVALYGGYFGAGIGILMLASLGIMGLTDIHEMNTLKTVLGFLINLVAAIYFVCAGLIDWPKMGVVTMGALAGYYLGSHYSQRISQRRVRQIIAAVGLTISAVLFYRQFK